MKTLGKFFLIALVGLLGACAALPQSTTTPTTPVPQKPAQPEAQPAAVMAAVTKLSGQLSITSNEVTIVSFVAKDWPDSCLGAAQANEICTQVVTPGYQVVLKTNNAQYTFRTNSDGSLVRPEPQTTEAAASSATDLPTAVQSARQALAKTLGVTTDALQVVRFEAVDWPDGCLGVIQKGVMCTDMVTPGYRVILGSDQQQWEYHTDKTGNTVLLAKGPNP